MMDQEIATKFEQIKNNNIVDVKEKEEVLMKLGEYFRDNHHSVELAELIKSAKTIIIDLSKAKAGKIIRLLVDNYLEVDDKDIDAIQLIKDCIEWTVTERRNYLRQNLEAKLMRVLYERQKYEEALTIGSTLLKELKKLDDKALLVEVQLLESRVYYSLSNLQRSKAALTSSRTTANGIYCPPKMQAALDLQSGILHAADERDFKTAYSYFYEAFEGFDSCDNKWAVIALKYMLMAKIMLNLSDEVPHILSAKLALKYRGEEIEAMRQIALAAKQRSLSSYIEILEQFKTSLTSDVVISKHLYSLYDRLLGENLIKLIEPYSRVQMEYLASRIDLPLETVERKLSQMILDKKLNGILNQESGVLVIFDKDSDDKAYDTSLEIIHGLSDVVDHLYQKAKKLT